MENLQIKPSKTEPEITLECGRKCSLSGRSIPEDPEAVYGPVIEWFDQYFSTKPEEQTVVEFRLEYLNSGSAKYILEILKRLKRYHDQGFPVLIKWFYEEEDEAILEQGEMFRDTSKLPFEIIPLY